MSDVRPLRGIRYAADRTTDISSKLAPPYDVLDESDKQRLLEQDPNNFVRIDLPHTPPKAAGPVEKYEQAARDMQQWLQQGVLVRESAPAIYVYHQQYEYAGTEYVRRMFCARLQQERFGEGSVYPHEETFGGPKEDRLALTKATRANLSPIFGLYQDEQNEVAQHLESAIEGEPLLAGTLDGVQNRLWAVTDDSVAQQVAAMMQRRAIFIADGHHRYGTGLLYREFLEAGAGELPQDHPARFILIVLCAMEDPGLLILPTHRVLPDVKVSGGQLRDDERLEVAHLTVNGPDEVAGALKKFGPQAIALYEASKDRYLMVKPREETILDDIYPEHSRAWRRLAVSFFHAYVVDRFLAPKICGGRKPTMQFVKSTPGAVEQAKSSGGSAFLMPANTMEELREVCHAGDLMPQKSTFFYPKLASGLVVNPLEE